MTTGRLERCAADGAHDGHLASWAFGPPCFVPKWTIGPENMLDLVETAATAAVGAQKWPEALGDAAGFDRVTWICAGAARRTYLADPRCARLSALDLWRVVVAGDRWGFLAEGESSPTLFQWGWGVNCARRLVELPPIPNPGLVIVEGEIVAVVGSIVEVLAVLDAGDERS